MLMEGYIDMCTSKWNLIVKSSTVADGINELAVLAAIIYPTVAYSLIICKPLCYKWCGCPLRSRSESLIPTKSSSVQCVRWWLYWAGSMTTHATWFIIYAPSHQWKRGCVRYKVWTIVNIDPSLVKLKAEIGRIRIENNATNLYRSSSEKDANLNIFHLVLY